MRSNKKVNVRAVYNRRRDQKIEIEIYVSRNERKFIATGLNCSNEEWDNTRRLAIGPNAQAINSALTGKIQDIWATIGSLQEVSISGLTDALKRDANKSTVSFIEWAEERIAEASIRESTRRRKLVTIDAIVRFKRFRTFSDLTLSNLERFDNWLRFEDPFLKKEPGRKTIHRTQATIHNYHKDLKVLFALAYKQGYIERNPYDRFTDARGSAGKIEPLDESDIKKIESLDLSEEPTLRKARDFFMFQIYTGMAYSDAMNFSMEEVTTTEDGRQFILAERVKTGQKFYTPLLPQAKKILDLNHGEIPKIDNSSLNVRLKIIAAMAGITKRLSTHVARHTFITLSLEAGTAPNVVQKMVGHSSLTMTERYTHLSLDYIEKGAEILFSKPIS